MGGAQTHAAPASRRFRPLRRLTDDELTVLVAGGDRRAFGTIFERYHEPLYRYSLSMLGNKEKAADALQNTMLAALRGLQGETRSVALRPWLFRIAHNESLSLGRGRVGEDSLERLGVGAGMDAATSGRLDVLLVDLRSLPEDQRSALLLRELGGLEYEEVGAALEITSDAARQAVLGARHSLLTAETGRPSGCDAVQSSMSAGDSRFQRPRDIRAHLEDCADCRAFAAALTQRPRDLRMLFALPAVAAESVSREADEADQRDRRRKHGLLLAVLLLAAGVASAGAYAALGGLDSGTGGVRTSQARAVGQAAAGVTPGGSASKQRSQPFTGGAAGPARKRAPAPKPARHSPPSAVSGYSPPGTHIETTVTSGRGLPLTGLEVVAVLATALLLLAAGLGLRRAVRTTR
jgi:RNA polymerase sigma factor (sigma-70 family)